MTDQKAGDRQTGKLCSVCSGELVATYDYVWPSEWGSRPVGPGGRAPLRYIRTRCSKCGLLFAAGGGLPKPMAVQIDGGKGGRE